MNWDEECQKIDMEEELGRLREALTPIREVWEKHKESIIGVSESNEYVFLNKVCRAISQTMAILEGK